MIGRASEPSARWSGGAKRTAKPHVRQRIIPAAPERDSPRFPSDAKYGSLPSQAAIRCMGGSDERSRQNHSQGSPAAELRALATRSDDTALTRRLLAIAMVVEGTSRLDAARQTGMDRQTLRDWVHRYNAVGVDGLASRKPPGASSKLSEAQMRELDGLVMAGPDPKIHKVVRWRCVDLRAEVTKRFSVTVSERTIAKWLRKLKLTRLQPRPFHPKRDEAAQEAFKQHFAAALKRALLGSTAATPVEIWLQDEARVGQKGGHTYVWAKVGSRPPMVRDNRHDSAYLFGAICPVRAVGAAIIAPTANTECMNLHLQEISTQVTPGAIAALLCDRAGCHQPGA